MFLYNRVFTTFPKFSWNRFNMPYNIFEVILGILQTSNCCLWAISTILRHHFLYKNFMTWKVHFMVLNASCEVQWDDSFDPKRLWRWRNLPRTVFHQPPCKPPLILFLKKLSHFLFGSHVVCLYVHYSSKYLQFFAMMCHNVKTAHHGTSLL